MKFLLAFFSIALKLIGIGEKSPISEETKIHVLIHPSPKNPLFSLGEGVNELIPFLNRFPYMKLSNPYAAYKVALVALAVREFGL